MSLEVPCGFYKPEQEQEDTSSMLNGWKAEHDIPQTEVSIQSFSFNTFHGKSQGKQEI